LTWEARSADERTHAVEVYFDAGAELTVNTPDQRVVGERARVPGLEVVRCGSEDQPVLAKAGDDLRIDWGYLYLAAPAGPGLHTALGEGGVLRAGFANAGGLPEAKE